MEAISISANRVINLKPYIISNKDIFHIFITYLTNIYINRFDMMNPSIDRSIDHSFSMPYDSLEVLIPSFNDWVFAISLRPYHTFEDQLVPSLILIVSCHDSIFWFINFVIIIFAISLVILISFLLPLFVIDISSVWINRLEIK